MSTNINQQKTILFIHGIYQNQLIMMPLANKMGQKGYNTLHFNYQTLMKTPDKNASKLIETIGDIEKNNPDRSIILVTHSLGSLLAQYALEKNMETNVEAVISITPPFQGSEISQNLIDTKLAFVLGRSKEILLPKKTPNQWMREDIPLGVIAGSKAFGLTRLFIKNDRENDGTVYLHETKIEGMRDHITLHYPHTEILLTNAVSEQIDHFITHAQFNHSLNSPDHSA